MVGRRYVSYKRISIPPVTHLIDWFHVAMKLTVLQQQNKAFMEENPEGGKQVAKTLERVKHYLWHGNVDKALECLGLLLFDLDVQRRRFPVAAKLERGVTEFDTYIRNNQKFIPNFGERYRQGDTISTAFVESTINQVVSKRFVKKQQMVRHEVARRNERMSTLSVVLSCVPGTG